MPLTARSLHRNPTAHEVSGRVVGQSEIESPRIFAPLPLQRPQKQTMQKTNCDRHRSELGLPSFLILAWGNDSTRPTGGINGNSPLYTKRPPERETSTKIFVICHFSFRNQPTRRLPPPVSWGPAGRVT